MTSSQSYDLTFDALLLGVGSRDIAVLGQNKNSLKKLTKLTSPNHAKDFMQNSKEIESQYQEKISSNNIQKNELSSVINELFSKKPKRNNDKVMLSTEIRTSWVNFYKDLHTLWEKSESKKEITYLAGIESTQEKDMNYTVFEEKSEGRPTRRMASNFRQSISLQKNFTDDYSPGSASLKKIIVGDSAKQNEDNEINLKKEELLRESLNAKLLEEQRRIAEEERLRVEEANRIAKLKREEEERIKREEEQKKKLQERIDKKVQAYLVQIPEFSQILNEKLE